LKLLAEKINADCVELRRRSEKDGFVTEVLVRIRADLKDFMEIR
jgi:GTPase